MVTFTCVDCESTITGPAGAQGQCEYCGAWNDAPESTPELEAQTAHAWAILERVLETTPAWERADTAAHAAAVDDVLTRNERRAFLAELRAVANGEWPL